MNIAGNSQFIVNSGSYVVFNDGAFMEMANNSSTPTTPVSAMRFFASANTGNDDNTVLYLTFAGAHGATTFTDRAKGTPLFGGTYVNNTVTGFNSASVDRYIRQYGSGSLSLDGINQYVVVTDNTNYDFSTNEWTLDAWVYITAAPSATMVIAGKGAGTDDRFELSLLTTQAAQFIFNDGTNTFTISGGQVNLYAWNHIAVERNNDTTSDFRLYVNGQQAAATTGLILANYNFDLITGNFNIGRHGYGLLIATQDETFFDNSPTTEGIFSGGTGHVVSDVLTLDDGSTITVDAVSGGVVTQFTVTTVGTGFADTFPTLNQTGSTGVGTGFTLTPDVDNAEFNYYTGNIDNVRIQVGQAKYVGGFIPRRMTSSDNTALQFVNEAGVVSEFVYDTSW